MSTVKITVERECKCNKLANKIIARVNFSNSNQLSHIKVKKGEVELLELSFTNMPVKDNSIGKDERRLRKVRWIEAILSCFASAIDIVIKKP